MIDPLSMATRGKFTSSSYGNNYPITVATLGVILPEASESENLTRSGGSSALSKPRRYKRKEDPFLIQERERLRKALFEDVNVEVEESDDLILPNPVSLQAPSLSEIKDDIERDIARILRHRNILEFAEKLRKQEIDDELFMEELALMMVLLDD